MADQIYQVKIALKGSRPKIWRRLLIPANILLEEFHIVIQIAMGWENAHLHQFIKDGINYTKEMEDDMWWDEMDNVDYENVKVFDLLQIEKDKIVYEYDFGDSWEHDITLEKILPVDKNTRYPVCLAGKMNCPPEDSGGVWGYAEMLEVLKDPKHENYEDYLEWMGDDFDPAYFNKDDVNEMLEKWKIYQESN